MLAKKCDRCGKLYEHYGNNNKREYNAVKPIYRGWTGNEYAINNPIDLCPECMGNFKDFMKAKIEGNEENAK